VAVVEMTALSCTVCGRPLNDCQCPDIDERMRKLVHDDECRVMIKWCRKCDKHYARCLCGTPEFFIIYQNEDITDKVKDGIPNLLGDIVVPDLKRP
jgi:hypothetical protein